MKLNNSNIRNRLGNNAKKRSANGVHQRIGIQNTQTKKRVGEIKEPIVTKSDIRHKLIAKKRSHIMDARDRLAEIAKEGDAREKLNKIKTIKAGKNNIEFGLQKLQQGQNVVLSKKFQQKQNVALSKKFHQRQATNTFVVQNTNKFINQGKNAIVVSRARPTGLTGRTTNFQGTLTRTVSTGNNRIFTKGRKFVNQPRPQFIQNNPDRYHPLKNIPNVVTIRNDRARPVQKLVINRSTKPQRPIRAKRTNTTAVYHERPQVFEVPMSNLVYDMPRSSYESDTLWAHQPMSNMQVVPLPEVRPTQLRITTDNDYMETYTRPVTRYFEDDVIDAPYVPTRTVPVKRPYTQYEEEYMPVAPKKQPILSSNMISRLEEKESQRPVPGFKVLVTNLHSVVTLEDVEELFGNIGPIKNARIVRPGVAELSFNKEDDAHRSVDVYHNRQLDGKAMNVIVMTKKPTSAPMPSSRPKVTPTSSAVLRRRPSPQRYAKPVMRATNATNMNTTHHQMMHNKSSYQGGMHQDMYAIKEALANANNALVAANHQYRYRLNPRTAYK